MRVTAATCTAAGVGNGDFAAVLRHVNAVAGFKCQRFITHNFLIGSTCCAARCAIARRTCACMRHGHIKAIGFQLRHIHRIVICYAICHITQHNRAASSCTNQINLIAGGIGVRACVINITQRGIECNIGYTTVIGNFGNRTLAVREGRSRRTTCAAGAADSKFTVVLVNLDAVTGSKFNSFAGINHFFACAAYLPGTCLAGGNDKAGVIDGFGNFTGSNQLACIGSIRGSNHAFGTTTQSNGIDSHLIRGGSGSVATHSNRAACSGFHFADRTCGGIGIDGDFFAALVDGNVVASFKSQSITVCHLFTCACSTTFGRHRSHFEFLHGGIGFFQAAFGIVIQIQLVIRCSCSTFIVYGDFAAGSWRNFSRRTVFHQISNRFQLCDVYRIRIFRTGGHVDNLAGSVLSTHRYRAGSAFYGSLDIVAVGLAGIIQSINLVIGNRCILSCLNSRFADCVAGCLRTRTKCYRTDNGCRSITTDGNCILLIAVCTATNSDTMCFRSNRISPHCCCIYLASAGIQANSNGIFFFCTAFTQGYGVTTCRIRSIANRYSAFRFGKTCRLLGNFCVANRNGFITRCLGINASSHRLIAGCAVVVVVVVGSFTVYMIKVGSAACRDIGDLVLQTAGYAEQLAAVDGIGTGSRDLTRRNIFQLAFRTFSADGNLIAGTANRSGKTTVSGRTHRSIRNLNSIGRRSRTRAQHYSIALICGCGSTQNHSIANSKRRGISAFKCILTDGHIIIAGNIRTCIYLAVEVVIAFCTGTRLGSQRHIGAAIGILQRPCTQSDIIAAGLSCRT